VTADIVEGSASLNTLSNHPFSLHDHRPDGMISPLLSHKRQFNTAVHENNMIHFENGFIRFLNILTLSSIHKIYNL
jgi:hypothetical protein